MAENQVWLPQGRATTSTPVPSGSRQLVLIGDIVYHENTSEDISWETFAKQVNFGNGVRTFQVMKTWFEPNPGGRPIKNTGPGYEITVRITVPPSVTTTF